MSIDPSIIVYSDLRRMGRSHAEATDAIQAQRQFVRRFGTPTLQPE
jgi:hypothetical protein